MKTYRVAVIPGDGIGREVIPAAIRTLETAAERFGFRFAWEHFPWGSEHYFAHGRMMPEDALDRLRPFDAIFFGAVGDPRLQDNVTLNGLLLPIRRGFDQYACVRPAVLYPGVPSPLAGRKSGDIDFVVVRENTEGEYAQVGGLLYTGGPQEVAMQAAMFTRHGTERVIRFAFDLTRRRNRKRLLTSVTKSNAQGYSMAFWDRVFTEVSRDYPDIRTESLLVDAACMDLVRRPQDFDVIVDSSRVEQPKPDAAAYSFAMQELREAPGNCVAIEDNADGVKAAVAAGLVCVAFPNENTAEYDIAGAAGRVDRLDVEDLQLLVSSR